MHGVHLDRLAGKVQRTKTQTWQLAYIKSRSGLSGLEITIFCSLFCQNLFFSLIHFHWADSHKNSFLLLLLILWMGCPVRQSDKGLFTPYVSWHLGRLILGGERALQHMAFSLSAIVITAQMNAESIIHNKFLVHLWFTKTDKDIKLYAFSKGEIWTMEICYIMSLQYQKPGATICDLKKKNLKQWISFSRNVKKTEP